MKKTLWAVYYSEFMKVPIFSFHRVLSVLALAAVSLLGVPSVSLAKDKHKDRHYKHKDSRYDRHYYYSRPRSSFSIFFGNGYAGPGYYYGPPGVPYYYRAPGVVYYRERSLVPSRYYVRGVYTTGSTDYAVQRALARRGYYRGPIDGAIGPMSRRAIARYQDDHGLPVTGTITSSLLRSLGI
jgi:hypothetical protein